MDIVAVFFEAFLLTLASAAAALLLCVLLYYAFRTTGHATWGPFLALVLIPIAVAIPSDWFVDTTAMFVAIFALPLCLWGGTRASATKPSALFRTGNTNPDPTGT